MLKYVKTAFWKRLSRFFQAEVDWGGGGGKTNKRNSEEFVFYVDFVFVQIIT